MTKTMRIISFLLLLVVASQWALADPDDDCKKNPHHCSDGSPIINVDAGSTIIDNARDRTLALGFGGSPGDVAISGCYASTQWGAIGVYKQKIILNMWCIADRYDQQGKSEEAAKARCSIKEIRSLHTSDASCLNANTFTYQASIEHPSSQSTPSNEEVLEEHEELEEQFHEEQLARYHELAQAIEEVRRQNIRPQTAPAPRPVTQQIGLTEAQRQALEEVFKQ